MSRTAATLLGAVLAWACTVTIVAAHIPEDRQARSPAVVAHPPNDGTASDSWCASHIKRGELVQAFFDCNHAVAQAPDKPNAYSNRGSLFLMIKETERALADFEVALRLNPKDPSSYYNRGLAKARLGRGPEAIADYTEAIRINPDMAVAHHNRGYEYERLGQRDKAIEDYRQALKIQPGLKPSELGLKRLRGDL